MKSILVTGAASGIGAATIRKLASKNISFTLTTKSNEKGLELIAEYARKKGSNVNTLCGDLSNINFLETLVNLARNETGNIDQFAANAGYANKQKFGEFSNDEINRSIQTMAISFSSIINL